MNPHLHHHQQMENEVHSPAVSPHGPRVPTTNGETSHSSTKPMTVETSRSSRSSPSTPKPYQQPPSPSKSNLEYRAMRELLADNDKRPESHFSMEQNQPQIHNGSQLKINQALQDKLAEKTERESPHTTDNQQPITLSSSPMQFSNDSDSGDGNFDEIHSKFLELEISQNLERLKLSLNKFKRGNAWDFVDVLSTHDLIRNFLLSTNRWRRKQSTRRLNPWRNRSWWDQWVCSSFQASKTFTGTNANTSWSSSVCHRRSSL